MHPDDATDADLGIDNSIRCACGGQTASAATEGITVYTCLVCGQWVATMRFEFADGATVEGEDVTAAAKPLDERRCPKCGHTRMECDCPDTRVEDFR